MSCKVGLGKPLKVFSETTVESYFSNKDHFLGLPGQKAKIKMSKANLSQEKYDVSKLTAC